MDILFFHSDDYYRMYNCDNISIDAVPLEQRQSPIMGAILMALFILYYILYIPCMYTFWKHLEHSCYKFLFYIGIVDLVVLWVCGFETAYFGLTGTVYCSTPLLMYISGVVGSSFWAAETAAGAVLAFNRCIDMISPRISTHLFSGKRSWIWLSMVTMYTIYWIYDWPPVIFSGKYFAWLFEPYVDGYRNVTEDYSRGHSSMHNTALSIYFPCIYLVFAIAMFARKRMYGSNKVSRAELMIILQIFLISVLNSATASIYTYIHHQKTQDVKIGKPLIILATFSWFLVHGFPPIIYIALNKTVRTDCRKLLTKIFRPDKIATIGGVAVIVTNTRNQ